MSDTLTAVLLERDDFRRAARGESALFTRLRCAKGAPQVLLPNCFLAPVTQAICCMEYSNMIVTAVYALENISVRENGC